MNKELFESLDRISDTIFDIDIKVKAINSKLDELIKALHEYDDDMIMEPTPPCVGHDAASWEHEDELNKRMDVIGQNGNTGEHYTDVEFDDYGKRVGKDKDKSNNTQTKHVGNKKHYGGKKSAVVEHQKYPPHKH
jgi:hypothetical protein